MCKRDGELENHIFLYRDKPAPEASESISPEIEINQADTGFSPENTVVGSSGGIHPANPALIQPHPANLADTIPVNPLILTPRLLKQILPQPPRSGSVPVKSKVTVTPSSVDTPLLSVLSPAAEILPSSGNPPEATPIFGEPIPGVDMLISTDTRLARHFLSSRFLQQIFRPLLARRLQQKNPDIPVSITPYAPIEFEVQLESGSVQLESGSILASMGDTLLGSSPDGNHLIQKNHETSRSSSPIISVRVGVQANTTIDNGNQKHPSDLSKSNGPCPGAKEATTTSVNWSGSIRKSQRMWRTPSALERMVDSKGNLLCTSQSKAMMSLILKILLGPIIRDGFAFHQWKSCICKSKFQAKDDSRLA